MKFRNLKLIEKRTANHIYECDCDFGNGEAIIKFVTRAGLDRYERELNALKAGQEQLAVISDVPRLYGYGDSDHVFKGGKYLMMEKLNFNYNEMPTTALLLGALVAMWHLYLKGVCVTPRLRNIGMRTKIRNIGIGTKTVKFVKWLDFNDDTPEELGYKNFQFVDYFKAGPMCFDKVLDDLTRYYKKHGTETVDLKKYSDHVVKNLLLPQIYRTLVNVHNPIAIPEIEKSLRTETERKDPNFGKPVPPNRKCYDRLEMILGTHDEEWWRGKRVVDIGSNSGWFPINFARAGAHVVGYEIDSEKCDFGRLVAHVEGLDNVQFRSTSALNHVKKVDFITLLSTFNRWVLTPEEKEIIGELPIKEERQLILKKLWEKTDEMVVEIPNYWIKNALQGDFVPFMERQGAECKILGTSDNGRKLFYFKRKNAD